MYNFLCCVLKLLNILNKSLHTLQLKLSKVNFLLTLCVVRDLLNMTDAIYVWWRFLCAEGEKNTHVIGEISHQGYETSMQSVGYSLSLIETV